MSVTIDMAGPEGSAVDSTDFEKRKRTVTLKRSRNLELSPDDEIEQGRLTSDLVAFKKWLYESGVFSKEDSGREVQAALFWQKFARLMYEMGYVQKASHLSEGIIDYKFKPEDTMVTSFRRSDFDIPAIQNGKEVQYNLIHLARDYLGYYIDNGTVSVNKGGHYDRLMRDLNVISEPPPGPDRDPYFTAARYVQPAPTPPAVKKDPNEIPAFLKEPKQPSSLMAQQGAPADSATTEKPAEAPQALGHRRFFNAVARISTSSAGIAARSIVTSALMTSASRIAIVAGLGMFGVGAVPAGIAAGVAIGAWKTWVNYRRNGSGVQASFGLAATAGGAIIGAFGAEALIEPVAQYVAPAVRDYFITPASQFLQATGVAGLAVSARQTFFDPVANFFTDRGNLLAQIDTLKQQVRQLTGEKTLLTQRLALAGDEVDDGIDHVSDSGLITRKVQAVMIGPEGLLPDEVVTASVSENGGALAPKDAAALLPAIPEGGDPSLMAYGEEPKQPESLTAIEAAEIAPAFESYQVVRGDNLYRIAQRTYDLSGSELHEAVKKIIAANPELASEPDKLTLGQTLKLPSDLEQVAAAECDERRLRLGRSGACLVPSVG